MFHPSRLDKMPWMHIGAFLVFALLMLFDFKVAFRHPGQPLNAIGLSVANSEAQARDLQASYGTRFVAVRSDLWNCFRVRENIRVDFGLVTIPDRCQESYLVVVQTEACQPNKSEFFECTAGTWRWVPNPPCGTDSPSGWWLPPC